MVRATRRSGAPVERRVLGRPAEPLPGAGWHGLPARPGGGVRQEAGAGGARASAHSQPQGYQQELEITLEEAYKGTQRRIQTDGKEKIVRIPVGVRTGSKVRVAGAGPNGLDLYLIVNVTEDKKFERHSNDLHTTATVNVFTAMLGGEAEVETMAGKLTLNVPAGTQPDQVFRLAGRGMPHLKNPKEKGDLFVKLKIQIPKYLSPKQRELLDEASRIKF